VSRAASGKEGGASAVPVACTERALALLVVCVRCSEAAADRAVESPFVRQLLRLLVSEGDGLVTPAARRHVAGVLQALSSKLGAGGACAAAAAVKG
jgi:hypothetical protein